MNMNDKRDRKPNNDRREKTGSWNNKPSDRSEKTGGWNNKPSDRSESRGGYSKSGFKSDESRGSYGKPAYKRDDNRSSYGKPAYKKDESRGVTGGFGSRDDKPAAKQPYKRDDSRGSYGKPAYKKDDNRGGFAKPAYKRDDKPAFKREDKPTYSRDEKPAENLELNEGIDRLEGRNSVMEALKAGRSINKLLVAKGDREGSIGQIVAIARQRKILVQEVERVKLDSISITHSHQGVIAYVAAKDYVEVDDILALAEASGRPPFIVILDEITDAYNLGSILRTANAAGVHGVIIPKRRAIGLNAAVSKASAGAMEYVPVARVTNITQTIEYLKKNNIWVVGADSTGEKPYFNNDLKGAVALVIGSEGEGMGKLIRESCDFMVNIPMKGEISSLNAAVAGAIVIFEVVKQRSV